MYNVSMQQIEYFLTVAERGSLSEAAKVLFVTQPAVSKWLSELERELDAKLFVRTNRGVKLTKEGEFLYAEWKRILGEFCDSIEAFHALGAGIGDELNIGCLSGFDYDSFLPLLLRSYQSKYPDVQVNVSFYGFRDLRESLLNGASDLIFSVTFDLENLKGISQRIIDELPLYIAISSAHPLAQRERMNLIDVKDEVFFLISPDETQTGGKLVIRACERAGFTPAKIRYVQNLQSMAMAIKQGSGVTICSDEISKSSGSLIKLYPSSDIPVDSYTIAAWKTKEPTSATLRLIELMRTVGKDIHN